MEDGFVNYDRLKSKKGPCPNCKLHICVGESSCVHCNHQLTDIELASIAKYAKMQKSKGVKKGLIFFPIILFILYLIFALAQYNEI
ncbi:hypothetical protein HII17_05680 [Thalassotalea sp. M1531]|uniref:Uncharacterized protein n=1 Tax=Thalassotalea algicola TaxID=2716224 RepID=A0A7Y0LAN8_9GAMM|nr:hypothetical protein [Thalassotalea algicola]NMP31050.1 hypothetical protein [Thalassotalea algicola]